MMNGWQKNFIYLSQIIGISVEDFATGKRVGKTIDAVAGLREMYPRVSGLMIEVFRPRRRIYVPWKNVKKIVEDQLVYIDNFNEVAQQNVPVAENEILLKETFWDKQIVDISGSKVVRVNDLHLLREDQNLWVVHMDVGFKSLIRRLGWTRPAEFFLKWLFSYQLKEKFISWKFVQPISEAKGPGLLSLKTTGSRLSELHPADLADILIDLGTDERVVILKALDQATAAYTLQELPMKIRVQTAELLGSEQLSGIVNDMAVDEAVDLLSRFPRKKVNALLGALSKEKADQIRSLLDLSERVAGSRMNVEFVAARHTMTAGQVLEKVRAELRRKESIYYVYILDDADSLIGVVTLRQLLAAPQERPVTEFMRKRVAKVRIDTDIKDVAQVFYKYDFTVVPVVDKHNKLQGIITIKDALESVFPEIREEAEEIS